MATSMNCSTRPKTSLVLSYPTSLVLLFGLLHCLIPTSSAFPLLSPSSPSSLMTRHSLTNAVTEAITTSLQRPVELETTNGGGFAGGGGASTSVLVDKTTDTKYFVKYAHYGLDMLKGEYHGVQAMAKTKTIRVPEPIAYGQDPKTNQAFVCFEYLSFTGSGGSQYEMGVQLAKMHRHLSTTNVDKPFGFVVDNTIGATFQPNTWTTEWADFWDQHRLGHMLRLTDNVGLSDADAQKLRDKTKQLLAPSTEHTPLPSLLHGDLWGGNKGYCRETCIDETGNDGTEKVVPVIFDPATYYGDREADIAMTHLFGGFGSDFYEGYESEWPLDEGHEQRRTIYNLYHVLNHEVLFGGYSSQARNMIARIMKY